MKTFSPEEIGKQYNKLPEILKDAMYSPDVSGKMVATGKKFGLTIEKTGLMAEQTGYVVLGLVRPEEFIQILADVLGVNADKAREIAKEINSQVLYPLREALKATHQIEISEIEPEARIQKQELRAAPLASPPTPPISPKPQQPSPSQVFAPGAKRPEPKDSAKIWEGKPTPPPLKVSPPLEEKPLPAKTTSVVESKFFDKFAAPKQEARIQKQELKAGVPPQPTPSLPKASPPPEEKPLKPKQPEPAKPPALPTQPKIPPIDLRRSRPERMREAIFAPPMEPESGIKKQELREEKSPAPEKTIQPASHPEKKTPYGGYDPYREPAE